MSAPAVKKILYLGTSLERFAKQDNVLHYPVIRLIPRPSDDPFLRFCLDRLMQFSHILITSQNSVAILCNMCASLSLDPTGLLWGKCISIGPVTSQALRKRGIEPLCEALEFTQEGMLRAIHPMLDPSSYVFYPRSSLARSVIKEYLIEQQIPHEILDLYDTFYQAPDPKPSLEEIEEIFFTSPSTVEGFFRAFAKIPPEIRISFQGPITQRYFDEKYPRLKM